MALTGRRASTATTTRPRSARPCWTAGATAPASTTPCPRAMRSGATASGRREHMPELSLPVAKGVIDKAIQYEAFWWDDPADATDEATMTHAQRMVDIVTQASQNNSVSDAVLEILHVAQI